MCLVNCCWMICRFVLRCWSVGCCRCVRRCGVCVFGISCLLLNGCFEVCSCCWC